jgi:Zn-dependent M28 family amino/carboxypeptidase
MKFFLTQAILFFSSLSCFAIYHSDTILLKKHLTILTQTTGYRDHTNIELLNKTADYILTQFQQAADTAYFQEYEVSGQIYKNVICSFGLQHAKRVILGAHYDVCGKQAGADDNASGVVALLELSRLLKHKKTTYRVDLVAYTLEEPPYFRTEHMGSFIHAKSLAERNVNVYGMISLEMIGYFDDKRNSQTYPLGILKLFYGGKGDYITLVKKFSAGRFARKFSSQFRQTKAIRTKTFTGPAALPGIDFSDHLNYWKFGVSAFMITDTSFYRNKNYHQHSDTLETLDIQRMAQVIDGVYAALLRLE